MKQLLTTKTDTFVILARSAGYLRERNSSYSRLWMIVSMFALISFCAVIGLLFGALARYEFRLLPWILAGVSVWLIPNFNSIKNYIGYRQDERITALVDVLRYRTSSGELGNLVAGSGKIVWLTADGFCTPEGKLTPWSEYYSFNIDSPDPTIHRVTLYKHNVFSRSLPDRFIQWSFGLIGLLTIAIPAATNLRKFGLTNDILAAGAVICSYLSSMLSKSLIDKTDQSDGAGKHLNVSEIAVVSAEFYSRSEIGSVLRENLVLQRSKAHP